MEAVLQEAYAAAAVNRAIISLKDLQEEATRTKDADSFAPERTRDFIKSMLASAGQDYSALDPTGQKSADEMEAVLQEAFVAAAVNKARLLFAELTNTEKLKSFQAYQSNNLRNSMDSYLASAGQDYSALDPTGQKSAEAMEAVVQEAFAAFKVDKARLGLKSLQCCATLNYAGFDPKNPLNRLNSFLQEAGTDYSALDPTGQKSAEEMKAVVQEAFAAGAVNKARLLFVNLQTRATKLENDSHMYNPEDTLKMIRSCLEDAETDYSALDPTGQKSADEMISLVQEVLEGAQVNFATAQRYNQERERLYS